MNNFRKLLESIYRMPKQDLEHFKRIMKQNEMHTFPRELKNQLEKEFKKIGYISEGDNMFPIFTTQETSMSKTMVEVAKLMKSIGYEEYIDTNLNVAYLQAAKITHAFFKKKENEYINVHISRPGIMSVSFAAYRALPMPTRTDET